MTDIWISQGHQLAPRTYDRRGRSDFLLGGRRRNCRLLVVVRHPSSKCQLGKAGKMRKTRDIVDDKGAATSTSCPVNTVVQRWKLTDKIKKKSTRQHVPLNITRIDSVRSLLQYILGLVVFLLSRTCCCILPLSCNGKQKLERRDGKRNIETTKELQHWDIIQNRLWLRGP